MTITAHIVNAFTESGRFSGNPAAVILDQHQLTKEQRQALATKIGLSETVFLDSQRRGKALYQADFFTPTRSIEYCGHATIAAFSLVHEFTGKSSGAFDVQLNNKEETVQDIYTDEDKIFLRLKAPESTYGTNTLSYGDTLEIAEALGLKMRDFDTAYGSQIRDFGNPFILVPVKSAEALNRIQPNHKKLTELSARFNVIGIYPFTQDVHVKGRDASARMFAPAYGIPEESATGMAAAALAQHLYDDRGLKQTRFLIEQGRHMRPASPSLIETRLETSFFKKIKAIQVGGRSVLKDTLTLEI